MDKRQQIAISEFVSDRTPRPLLAPVLNFDLEEEVASLRQEEAWTAHGHNARTLIKHSELRLVLITLRKGYHLHEQQIAERVSLQILSGELRVHVPTETLQLRAAQLLALDRQLPFTVDAVEDSAFMLWLGWSKD
jgi:quercetin dioxygenase-like cupin family protein